MACGLSERGGGRSLRALARVSRRTHEAQVLKLTENELARCDFDFSAGLRGVRASVSHCHGAAVHSQMRELPF